mmetsp:Transcript_33241/g.87901  ORF Transcript_33241/g.87901 Transcript_33241/m.87901 type:complete len:205 (+) Transcript_33241:1119-1733(+)
MFRAASVSVNAPHCFQRPEYLSMQMNRLIGAVFEGCPWPCCQCLKELLQISEPSCHRHAPFFHSPPSQSSFVIPSAAAMAWKTATFSILDWTLNISVPAAQPFLAPSYVCDVVEKLKVLGFSSSKICLSSASAWKSVLIAVASAVKQWSYTHMSMNSFRWLGPANLDLHALDAALSLSSLQSLSFLPLTAALAPRGAFLKRFSL